MQKLRGNAYSKFQEILYCLEEYHQKKTNKAYHYQDPSKNGNNHTRTPTATIQLVGTHATFYAKVITGQIATNFRPIAEKLQELLVGITLGQTDIKDSFIDTVMAILSLLLTHHD